MDYATLGNRLANLWEILPVGSFHLALWTVVCVKPRYQSTLVELRDSYGLIIDTLLVFKRVLVHSNTFFALGKSPK